VENIGDRATPKSCANPSPQFNPVPPESVHKAFNNPPIPSTPCGLPGQVTRLAGLWRFVRRARCWQFAGQRINPGNPMP